MKNISTQTSFKLILLFQSHLEGHIIEYLKHFINDSDIPDGYKLIAVVPKSEKLKKVVWRNSDTNEFLFLTPAQEAKCKYSIGKNRILRQFVNELNPSDVILLTNYDYQPYFTFFTKKKVRYHSMIYHIPLYEWNMISFKRKVVKLIIMLLQVKDKSIRSLLLCNGYEAADIYNRKLFTKKFVAFPDPCISEEPISISSCVKQKNQFAHIGVMSLRKGTLNIINAINELDIPNDVDCKWIFAGKILPEIRSEFYSCLKNNKNGNRIIVIDEFCSYETLKNICMESEYLLMPYSFCSQSSGMFGYASMYNIPVVATDRGMFKDIVQRYQLGYLLHDESIECLKHFFIDRLSSETKRMSVSKEYCETHTIGNFIQSVYNCIICR